MQVCELARKLYEVGAVLFGDFRLSSGGRSRVYIDLRRILSIPELYKPLVDMLAELVSKYKPEVVVGVATGGIPWASMVAYKLGIGLAYVRRERKEYGTRSEVEGLVESKKVVVVDDVMTTGSSLNDSIKTLRERGAKPVSALVIVDRCQGGRYKLSQLGLTVEAVVNLPKLLNCLRNVQGVEEAIKEVNVRDCAQTLL